MESSTTIKNPNNNNHADNHNLINNQSQQTGSLQNNNLTVSAQPFTPAANNVNNANNNNLAVQQSNNAIAPAQSYTPVPTAAAAPLHSVAATSTGHPIYNQAMHSPNMFVPAPGVHQAGPVYATMMPTQIPSNVYVNNVTANVNLHGWPHAVPTYIPAGAPHYIQGDVPPDQNPSVMQAIPGVPVALAPSNAIVAAGGNGNPSGQMGNLSSRGSRRGRGRGGSGGSRRGDYNNQRHPPPEGSPAPQPQMVQSQEQIGQPQSLTQQQQSQQMDASNHLMAAGPPSYAAQPQYAHTPTYTAYPYQTYFAAQNPMLHPGQAAQQATGTPLYVSHMPMYNPVYNYMGGPFVYPPVMNPPEYQFLPGEDGQCDERQNPEAMVAPMWHAQPIYADEYGMNPEMHNAGEEMNHNAASMGSVDTPSMLSPNYAMYDPQIHEVQQHMGMMHIYEESQMAPMPGMHPEAAVAQLEEEIVECAAQPGTIQMVASGTMISAGPIQMSNETQIIHHSHSQHQSQHIIQNTVLEMKTHHSSEGENINVENNFADEVAELQTVGSVTSLNEMHTHQSTENIVADDYQAQQQQQQLPLPQQPQQPQQLTQSPPKQQQAPQASAYFQPQNAADLPVAVPANELYHNQQENVPKEEPTEVPVATLAPAAALVAVAPAAQQQQAPTVAAVVAAQPAATAVASVSTATNVPTQQQQIQTSPPLQKYHQQQQQQQQHQQMHPKHQQQSYNRYEQQQQQHHNQQYHHQQNHNYQYDQRRPQQNYNNNQSRRKHDYNNPTYAPNNNTNNNSNNNNNNGNNNNDSAIQTTKTMSWTNSSKKSTASVAVTATPSNNNNNNSNNGNSQNRTYSRTYTNHQHHYQQQSHYHQHNQQQQQQHGGHYNQTPQMRNHGGMKVPSSPVGGNAAPQFGNNSANERRNSQAEQPKYANNSAYNNYNQYANNSGNNAANSGNANNAAASAAATSTASTTAAPQHFPQQQQQQQQQQHAQATQQQQQQLQQTAAQVSQNQSPQQQQALVIDSKQYPGFTSSKKAAAAAAATAAANATPIMNLAPPVTANTNTIAPSTQSWASLFNDTNNANTTSATSAGGAPSGNSSSNSNSNTNANTQSSNASPALPPPFSLKKPIAKVAPYECVVPAPVNPTPPVVLPGAMSYSAASAQGIPPQTAPSATKALVKPEPAVPTARANLDEYTLKFADFLTKAKTDLSTASLRPRGLTNPSNYCYINSILQALLGCAPFYNLIRSIPRQAAALSEVRTPTVNALISFASQFSTLPSGMRLRTNKGPKGKDELGSELQCDSAFEPSDIYRLWVDSRAEYVEGRQEDAEEFLSYVLNKLNDEMLEVIKLVAKPNAEQNGRNEVSESEDGDEWQMICNNRNKGSVTRQQDFGRTPLSDIFRGELRSRLQREGEHSTDAIQPFFTLQLNIEKAASVKEALEILVGRDQLEGVTGSKTKQEVVAWQQMTLEKLPTILILHLKWFDYRSDGCTKILKKVEFPVDLKIDAKILASKKYSMKQRAYRLFAVVYHDGKEATKGHYITDVYHTGYSSWLRYNDSSVKPVSENEVLYPKTPRVPYLLYYRRCDTMPQQSNNNASAGGNANSTHGGRDGNK